MSHSALNDPFLMQEQWARIGVGHHHGILISLASIHTASSGGIGEILDLIPLIEWLAKTDFSIIQLLPLNDTGTDASPYMALSAYALNPIYLSISDLPSIQKLSSYQRLWPRLEQLRALERVQYHEVLSIKIEILRDYFQQGCMKDLVELSEFSAFISQHDQWLTPYAVFRAIKEENESKAWWHFSSCAQRPRSVQDALDQYPHLREETLFWMSLQYLLFKQWERVRQAAEKHHILLMGDLPILVNKDSSDVWWHPELFSLQTSVGAPPDMYSKEGQNWGFPLYRWDRMREERFQWFSHRLKVQERLYDLFRIDHIVGLFRMWSIPPGKKANEGSFTPKEPQEWIEQGEELLRVIHTATSMLPIGEDLGDIPDSVRSSMTRLGIPGTRVLRWEKNWDEAFRKGEAARYISPSRFSPESLVTVSTHDSSTLEGWWKECPSEAKEYAEELGLSWQKELSDELRKKIMMACHQARSLFHINQIQEYAAFFPELSWNDPEQDRINIPGTVSDRNWTWKMKKPLEEFTQHHGLIELMQQFSSRTATARHS